MKPKIERISIKDVVEKAISRAKPRADLADARITSEVGDIGVMGDPALVGKILDNLINNALIYVEASPSVAVRAHKDDGQVSLLVTDKGIGISPDDAARIFSRFARGTDRRVLEKPGTGLGLYVSRVLAEQMGGSLRLEVTEPGKGSTFALRLPTADS